MSLSENRNMVYCKWKEDLKKYPKFPWLKEPSIIAIAWYRYGQWVDCLKNGILKSFQIKIYWIIFHLLEVMLGISIPKSAQVGGGLRIYHFGNIFIHNKANIGNECILRQGVTIGNRYNNDDVPIVGDRVELGAYAQVLGKIVIGNDVKIGALSVVLSDVPDGATVCGIPAKIKKIRNTQI